MATQIAISDDVYEILKQIEILLEKLMGALGAGADGEKVKGVGFLGAMEKLTSPEDGYLGDASNNLIEFTQDACDQIVKLIEFYIVAYTYINETIIRFANADQEIYFKMITGEYKGFVKEDEQIPRETLEYLREEGILDDIMKEAKEQATNGEETAV